jgi:hypothetical protein
MSPPTNEQVERGKALGIFFGKDDTEESADRRFREHQALLADIALDEEIRRMLCLPRLPGSDEPW